MSEAIRAAIPLGIKQGTGATFHVEGDGTLCACASGQALIGAGLVTVEQAKDLVRRRWAAKPDDAPYLELPRLSRTTWGDRMVNKTIALNDARHLTLPQIAATLEEIEAAQD